MKYRSDGEFDRSPELGAPAVVPCPFDTENDIRDNVWLSLSRWRSPRLFSWFIHGCSLLWLLTAAPRDGRGKPGIQNLPARQAGGF